MSTPVIEITGLHYRYDKSDAVRGLNLKVMPGRCHGLLGRNGSGKTTTMKCLLSLLRPQQGSVRLFGLDPAKEEVAVKKRLAYVPDYIGFYPWMSVQETLDFFASFRDRWNDRTEKDLLERFQLDPKKKVTALSKGQRTQLALITAICPEPELLILDEPTSGLDPIVRREFIETVIGAYQDADPANRTILVSTHLIAEFEGLIDEFTLIDAGRDVLTLTTDAARERYQRIHARFADASAVPDIADVISSRKNGRNLEVVVNGELDRVMNQLRQLQPEELRQESLSLEESFTAVLSTKKERQ
jgi:ABC-2 type transport system ATP-binding protein